jgi:hypothetical protein
MGVRGRQWRFDPSCSVDRSGKKVCGKKILENQRHYP